jgi:heme-degrading monooxygenase HmoA
MICNKSRDSSGSDVQVNGKPVKGEKMPIKVMIKRTVPQYTEADLLVFIKEMRVLTTQQPGYISGETLKRLDRTGQSLVISMWQSLEDWERWFHSEERSRIQKKIDALVGKTTEFQIYDYE